MFRDPFSSIMNLVAFNGINSFYHRSFVRWLTICTIIIRENLNRMQRNYFEISSLNDAEKLNVVQVYLHTGETSSYQLN